MPHLPIDSFIIQRLEDGGFRVVHRRADLAGLTDIPIADFVSHQDAQEWVNWKSGYPRTNPYADFDAPSRLVEIAIEARSKADQMNLVRALCELANDDPSFGFSIDHESGQTILKGTSELHLDAKVGTLKGNLDIRLGAPQVAFRETITRTAEVEYTHKKRSGSSGEFAAVKLRVEPGRGYQFESNSGGAVPAKYIPAIVTGVESVLASGIVAGFPVVDIKVTLLDANADRRLRKGSAGCVPRSVAKGGVGAARTGHEGRGGDAGIPCRFHHQGFQFAASPVDRPRCAGRCHCHQRNGAAHEHVRLRE